MISLKNLAKISFHFTCPNKINRKEYWLAFIYPIVIGFFLAMFPFLVWETAFFLVVIKLLPSEIMVIINFMVKFLAFISFATPLLYTYMVVSIKRLHDLGHSGFWWLINLIPVFILFITNYYGQHNLWLLTTVTPIVMSLFILYVGFTKTKRSLEGCLDNI